MGLFSDIAGGLTGGLNLATGIAGLINPQENKDIKRAQQLEYQNAQLMNELAKAIATPTDPRFQALQQAEREAATKRFQAGLQDVLRAHMRNRAIGGPGYITNPNRQDEMLWRGLAMQRELDDPAARARAALQSAGSTAAGVTPGAYGAGQLAGTRQQLGSSQLAGNIGRTGAGIEQLGTTFENLFGPKISGGPI